MAGSSSRHDSITGTHTVGQAVAQVLAHRKHDDVRRVLETSERRRWNTYRADHGTIVAANPRAVDGHDATAPSGLLGAVQAASRTAVCRVVAEDSKRNDLCSLYAFHDGDGVTVRSRNAVASAPPISASTDTGAFLSSVILQAGADGRRMQQEFGGELLGGSNDAHWSRMLVSVADL